MQQNRGIPQGWHFGPTLFLIAARSFTQMGKKSGRTPGNVRVRVEARERVGRGGSVGIVDARILVGTKATPNGLIRQVVGALSD